MKQTTHGFRIRIPHKLIACFGAIGVIVIFIFLLANRTILATADLLHETVSTRMHLMNRVDHLQHQAYKIRLQESALHRLSDFYAVSGTLDELGRSTGALTKELNHLVAELKPGKEDETARLLRSWQAYSHDLARSIRAARAMDKEELTHISTFSSQPRFRIFSRLLEQLTTRMGEDATAQFRHSIAELTLMRKSFLLMALMGIGIGIVFAWILSRSLSFRIRELGRAAMHLADGRLDKPIPARGQDEIAELASVFNIMQNRVKRRENDLLKAREELETRVEQRTSELAERTIELETQATALLTAKEDAEAAGRAKSEFLSNMSHELRTPLNAILGYAQILLRDEHLDARQKGGIDIIGKSGRHLLTLISDILDLSKIEAGRLEIMPADVHMAGLLNSIVSMIRLRAEEKGILLACDFAPDLPEGIAADEQRLRQVLINLLSNAVKFTRKGQVTFKVARSAGKGPPRNGCTLLFEVTDTGMGIPEEDLSKIFDPFEQAGASRDRNKGTGLGLAISQRLMDRMGSKIRVSSKPGKGSRFWFELWVPTLAELPGVMGQRKDVTGYTGKRRQVLIVDDLASNRAVLRDLLAPLGFVVTEATGGSEGVEKALELKPDLILMDIIMPGMDGFEATQRIRQAPGFGDVVILAVSADIERGGKKRCMDAGCDGFMPKPVVFSELMGLMEKHLGITWEYEAGDGLPPILIDKAKPPEKIPGRDKLEELYELARYGNMRRIRRWARELAEADSTMGPFSDHIETLAKGYREQRIIDLAAHHLGREGLQEAGLTT